MNSRTHFKKTPILSLLIAPALLALAAMTATPAFATPVCGVISENLLDPVAAAHYASGLLNLKCESDIPKWELETNVKGASDVYVTRHTFQPGTHTGWHTHPGPSLITVIQGTLTAYEGASCTRKVYTAGQSFTDIGCGDVHLVRNEGSTVAVDVAVQIVPAGAPRRIDAPAPACSPVLLCPTATPTPCPCR
jgi:quercetin dioxygenase-like cupin family protein